MDVKIEVNYKVNIGEGKGWKEWTPEGVESRRSLWRSQGDGGDSDGSRVKVSS